MAQDIILNGIVLEDVPALKVPKDGGGYAKFDDTTDADATAADILSGKTAYVDGVKLTGTGSGGGGGSSRQVIGTFTPSAAEKGTVKAISLGYTGNGYPISVSIFVSAGASNADDESFTKNQRYAILRFYATKSILTGQYAVPTYTGSGKNNTMSTNLTYKGNGGSTYGNGGSNNIYCYDSNAPIETDNQCVKFPSATSMKVMVANTSYGFMDGTEYTYIVTYSS